MTEENYNYRTSDLFLRNQFEGTGEFNIPLIPKQEFTDEELFNLLLIGFDKIKNDKNNFDRMVHFFLYDYKFENLWKKPEVYVEKLKMYKAVLSPDFSMYIEMNRTLQLYNTFRNRWCGAYLASKGIKVIPTVSWGNEDTFDFCFEGIEKGSIVAVSTYMVHEHGNHSEQKEFFMKGYNEMLKRLEPSKIICYSEPFAEMKGDIIYVDYELSSWKYLKSESDVLNTKSKNGRIIHKIMVQPDDILKGTGSAYGGKWKPKKPEDERFLGEPNSIKTFYFSYRIDVKYGPNGRAEKERHYSQLPNKKYHSNPHDHFINWEFPRKGQPNFVKPHINYWEDVYPDGVPEFKKYGDMNMFIRRNTIDENRFKTISEFRECITRGAEICFVWNNQKYGITPLADFVNLCILNEEESLNVDVNFENIDDLLNYNINDKKLREIITEIKVIDRTL